MNREFSTTNELLDKVRCIARKRDRVDNDFVDAIVEANAAGVSVRLIAIAAGLGHGTVHRILVRKRT